MSNAPLLHDDNNPFIKSIRAEIADIMKRIDEFVNMVEDGIAEKEQKLDEKMKEFAVLQAREQKLIEERTKFEQDRKILDKEKEENWLKSQGLKKKEEELNEKVKKVQSILY